MMNRIPYLDCIRGFAMLLVVYCHVSAISFGIPEKTGFCYDTVSLLHLPILFFLSGFLMYREERFGKESRFPFRFLGKKAKELIIPALIFVTVFAVWKHRSLDSVVFSQFKGGYWFTPFLFLFMLLYLAGYFPLRRFLSGKNAARLLFAGRRSLDIYLLHFFFLPDLHPLGAWFVETGNPFLEFCAAVPLVLALTAVCLLLGSVLRKSDTLARLLFGKEDIIHG